MVLFGACYAYYLRVNKQKKVNIAAAPLETPGIFLSYSWKQKAQALKVAAGLRIADLTVWLDEDRMCEDGCGGSDTVDAMSSNIAKAQVFVACYSKEYARSPNCKSECEYAHNLKKPSFFVNLGESYKALEDVEQGWLAFIMGATLYFSMQTDAKYESELPRLIRGIKSKLRAGSHAT